MSQEDLNYLTARANITSLAIEDQSVPEQRAEELITTSNTALVSIAMAILLFLMIIISC
ncbi:hypothetical protein GGQ84_002490 [Desulfitispora alkaliphila]|uniref:hypothetical protein n=1 Tax=Desulfitispora alkaliphila TaxID=622674 RepID=UPI003D2241AF